MGPNISEKFVPGETNFMGVQIKRDRSLGRRYHFSINILQRVGIDFAKVMIPEVSCCTYGYVSFDKFTFLFCKAQFIARSQVSSISVKCGVGVSALITGYFLSGLLEILIVYSFKAKSWTLHFTRTYSFVPLTYSIIILSGSCYS